MSELDRPFDQARANRINGFAVGDRVAIVNCELAGAYGKVEHSGPGCIPAECRTDCRIVFVELSHIPKGFDREDIPYYRVAWNVGDSVYRFRVDEVTHVD